MSRAAPLYLILRTGTTTCALPIESVIETLRPMEQTQVADCPPFVVGISRVRGIPTPAVDLGILLEGTTSSQSRAVTVRVDARQVALLVDKVVGLRNLDESTMHDLPPILHGVRDSVAQIGSLDGELLNVLQTGTLISQDLWERLDHAADNDAQQMAQ